MFVIEKCTAAKLSLKIGYNFLGHPVQQNVLSKIKQYVNFNA